MTDPPNPAGLTDSLPALAQCLSAFRVFQRRPAVDEGTASTTAPTKIRSYAYNAYGEIEKITDNTSFLTGGTLTTA